MLDFESKVLNSLENYHLFSFGNLWIAYALLFFSVSWGQLPIKEYLQKLGLVSILSNRWNDYILSFIAFKLPHEICRKSEKNRIVIWKALELKFSIQFSINMLLLRVIFKLSNINRSQTQNNERFYRYRMENISFWTLIYKI